MLKIKKKKDKKVPAGSGGGKKSNDGDEGGGKKIDLFGVSSGRKKSEGGKRSKKVSAAELRLQKDIEELDGGKVADISWPDPNDLMKMNVVVKPEQGHWKSGTYNFSITVPDQFPHKPPLVHCNTKIYHPNIDLEGHVCLNILRADWKPVLDINAVIYGIIFLFYTPNPSDPLNKEAAKQLRESPRDFEATVKATMKGRQVRIGGTYHSFPQMY
jgi:ubiquitin-conjugating enzyme E2 M|eukprot:g4906.t1